MSPLPIMAEVSKAQLDHFPPCLFPASNPTSTVSDYGASTGRGCVELVLEERWSAIEPSVKNLGVPLPTVLKAAWVLALRCFVPVDIICFGSSDQLFVSNGPNHGAGLEETRSSSDLMLYILRLDGRETIQDFLQRLKNGQKSRVVAAPPGYDIWIVEEQPSRHHCNTVIYYHECENEHGKLQSKLRNNSAAELTLSQVDLILTVTRKSNGQVFTDVEFWPYHTSEDMAVGVLRTFQHIFCQLVRAPYNLRLQDVDVCSDHDRRVIQELTGVVSQAENHCVHDIILKQCRLYPDQIAVCSWDGNLTYGELDDLSSRLAYHLVELGVKPETFVLSCFKKSTWAIVARLAILRAGGAYISVNAGNPPSYLGSIICHTNSQVLVSESEFADRFRDLVPAFVEVTLEWLRGLPAEDKSPVCETIRADNACLVIFTSGSTGQPKGIIQTHQSYATAIRDYVRNLELDSATRFLQFDDYAFDISNLEFMVPLFIGGCCCVPGPMKTVQDLANNINSLKANVAFLTPTVAIKLVPADVPCLKILCVGGEPLSRDLLTKWASSTTKLINQYGMGEVAICCAYNDQIHLTSGGNLGRPASGAIWVVDASSPEKLIPIGAVGEFLIEGPHLSRRYLDNTFHHRTEAAFLDKAPQWMADMHPERCSARLYRSGDLGRLYHNGTFDYIGRKDTILKMDGCRIDAVEVEYQARKALSPEDSIVVDILGIIDGREDPVLTAFLYLHGHPASTAPALEKEPFLRNVTNDVSVAEKVAYIKASIGQALPDYMIPTVFLLITWMPRTASNKTDRKKIRWVGQKYYLVEQEKRRNWPSYVQRQHLLPV